MDNLFINLTRVKIVSCPSVDCCHGVAFTYVSDLCMQCSVHGLDVPNVCFI